MQLSSVFAKPRTAAPAALLVLLLTGGESHELIVIAEAVEPPRVQCYWVAVRFSGQALSANYGKP